MPGEGPGALGLARQAVKLALEAGAGECDAMVSISTESNVTVRLGELEKLIEAGSMSLGLRVINGGRTAVCSTSDFSPGALARFAAETVELANIAAPDECAGLPTRDLLARDVSAGGLGLYDEAVESMSTEEKVRIARACEGAAFAIDPRISNSDGASFSTRSGEVALANSAGFAASYPATSVSLVVEAMADDTGGKKRPGYWFSAERSLARLTDPEEVGRIAARRALDQLGARKVPTCTAPVIFEPMMAAQLMGMLAGCAGGTALYRGATFLAGRAGQQLGSPLVHIVDDPLLPGRFGTRPFDGEGVPARRNVLFDGGVFQGFLFDCYTARKTGNATTGSAQRGVDSLPSPGASNLVWQPGNLSPGEIIGGVARGLYLTTLMGMGFNPSTGDFSQGAAGFWIEDGQIAFPVTEINISGAMPAMLAGVDAAGDDLAWFGSSAAPTIRISEMTISGE